MQQGAEVQCYIQTNAYPAVCMASSKIKRNIYVVTGLLKDAFSAENV
jgi:hypothetical protein